MKKNLHLVPVNIQDIAEKLSNTKNMSRNELSSYIVRLETIRDYCNEVVNKAKAEERKRVPDWKNTREICS